MEKKVALITGVTGIVGQRLAEHLAARSDWQVTGVSRRIPKQNDQSKNVTYVQLDLRDAEECRSIATRLEGITHLFNASRSEHDTSTLESPDTNTEMLANLLNALEAARQPLRHVHIVQGTKYYGSHLGPFRTPAKESDARSLQSNFYYRQEDLVIERSLTGHWSWSASRPHAMVDVTKVKARSIPVLIAIYAVISRELGLPLCFPGTEENYRALYQFTEAGLLARAITWMATSKVAENQSFNVTNGDYIRWCNVWPGIARYFQMKLGPVRTVRLATVMADKAVVWKRIIEKNSLARCAYEDVALWPYGDFVFTPGWDIMSSMNKSRLSGFLEMVDSEAMIFQTFDTLRKLRVIPDR